MFPKTTLIEAGVCDNVSIISSVSLTGFRQALSMYQPMYINSISSATDKLLGHSVILRVARVLEYGNDRADAH